MLTKLRPSMPHLTINGDVSMSFASSTPIAYPCPASLFQPSYFLVSSLFSVPIPTAASLHPSPDTRHSHWRVEMCVGTCKHAMPLKSRTNSSQTWCPSQGETSQMGLKVICWSWPDLTTLGLLFTNSGHQTAQPDLWGYSSLICLQPLAESIQYRSRGTARFLRW